MKRKSKTNERRTEKKLVSILIRYLILLILALIISSSLIFYNIFLKLTIYPTSFFLNFFYTSIVYGNNIIADNTIIEIIPACVAVSAYFLLLILNLTTPISIVKRILSLIFSFILLLVINILRIVVLSVLLIQNFVYFDIVHKFVWYFLSIVIVVGIWFLAVYLFNIKEVPVYTDFKLLLNSTKTKSAR